jgi:hypothetical protein
MHVAQETSQTGLTARYVAEDGRKTVLKVPPHAPKAPQP